MLNQTLRTLAVIVAALPAVQALADVTVDFENGGRDLVIRQVQYDYQNDPVLDEFEVEQNGDFINVFGRGNDTASGSWNISQVNGLWSGSFPVPDRDLVIIMLNGISSKVTIRNIDFSAHGEDLRVDGVEDLTMENCAAVRNAKCGIFATNTAWTGEPVGVANLVDCVAAGSIKVSAWEVAMANCWAMRDLDVNFRTDATIDASYAGRMLWVDSVDGDSWSMRNNDLRITDCFVGRAAEIFTYNGSDDVVIDGLTTWGGGSLEWLKVSLGDQNDWVTVGGCRATFVEINGGRGRDTAYEGRNNPNNFPLDGTTTRSIEWTK